MTTIQLFRLLTALQVGFVVCFGLRILWYAYCVSGKLRKPVPYWIPLLAISYLAFTLFAAVEIFLRFHFNIDPQSLPWRTMVAFFGGGIGNLALMGCGKQVYELYKVHCEDEI